MRKLRQWARIAALATVVVIGATGTALGRAPLYGNKDKYKSGSPVTVRVCWENPGAVAAQRRDWVRETIEGN